mmetsp:Transcript_4453/g.13506  ORF Transcript_4453/g.13506 Transcript_4453/m.13506 type:complete len:269 (+) Transcript_4453:132-938(+)
MMAFLGGTLKSFVPGARWQPEGVKPTFTAPLATILFAVVVGQVLIAEHVWLVVPFWYCVAAVFLCLLISAAVDPGYVDAGMGADAEPRGYCVFCDGMKPSRAHHCSRCNRCVRVMDHHCAFLQNCVGTNNRRHFVLLLYHAALATGIVLVFSPTKVISYARTLLYSDQPLTKTETAQAVLSIVCYLQCIGIFASTLCLAVFQTVLVGNDETTIEYQARRREGSPLDKSRASTRQDCYTVFGDNPWYWMVPFVPVLRPTLPSSESLQEM